MEPGDVQSVENDDTNNSDVQTTRLVAVARGHDEPPDETDRTSSLILQETRAQLGPTLPMVPEEHIPILSGTTRRSTTCGKSLAGGEIHNDCNRLGQSSFYDSHESFHTANEHTHLLPEGELENVDMNGGRSEEVDSQQEKKADEDEVLIREKQSFEEGGMVTLYSSSRNGQTRNGYHRYDSRTQTSKDDKITDSFSADSCGIIESEVDESETPAIGIHNMDERNGSAIDETVTSETIGPITLTLADIGSLSVPCSPANELRQRHATQYPDSNNATHDSDFAPNRLRSYTSPDSRSPPRHQPHHRNQNQKQTVPSSSNDLHQTPQRILLSSLDSGMSALRRWMVSHSPGGDGSYRRRSETSHAAEIAQVQINDLEESNFDAMEHLSAGNADIWAQSSRSLCYSDSIDSDEQTTAHSTNSHPLQGTILYPQTIEEEDEHPARQRANSEPERSRLMPFNRQRRGREVDLNFSSINQNRSFFRQQRTFDVDRVANLETSEDVFPSEPILSSDRLDRVSSQIGSLNHGIELMPPRSGHNSTASILEQSEASVDPNREARMTWIRITRRFQLLVVLVGLIFSSLLFSIMVTWVVLMSAYVVSIDDGCDLPLKPYFWFATIQLMLDVFRKDIMKFVFRFDSRRQGQQIPTRVIFYNLAYLTYAMLVLRVGVFSVFLTAESQCPQTATKLFNTTRVFVSISIAAWLLVLFGYLIPFCVVAILLTRNGYSPETELNQGSRQNIVVPLSNASNGAPPGCIDKLKAVTLEDFGENENFPNECCVS
eukprot:scaffold2154_cov283-Chaetoceros_neogracile.AAC.40